MTTRSRAYALIAALALLSTLVLEARAQDRVATTAAQFLTIGTGAEGSALGHAYTASATGANALFWNPAGLARQDGIGAPGSVFFSHADWLVGIDYNAFAVGIPLGGSGALGLSLAQLDYGRMDVRTVEVPEGTGESFGASDLVVGLSYAQPLTDAFYIGGTAKYVRQGIYDMSAQTVALDIGLVLVTDYFNGARLAASIMNFGGKMTMGGLNLRDFHDPDPSNSGNNPTIPVQYETDSWDLPLSFKFGVAVPVINFSYARLELLGDAHQTNDNALNADFGSQLRFMIGSAGLDLRVGYKDLAVDDVDTHLSYGAGIDMEISGFRGGANFAYIPFDRLGNVPVFDVWLNF